MTDYAFTIGGEPITFRPEDDHFRADQDGVETWHPRAALTIWAYDELTAHSIVKAEVPASAPTAADRLAALADLRWQKSQAFTYDGVLTQADPAIAVVNATLSMRERRGVPAEAPQTWKLSQADFRQWNEPQIEAFGFAIADHIQACFDREAVLTAMILAANDPASVHINIGWPT